MNAEFKNTIDQLESELEFLENEVQACIEDKDFKFAKYYQKAIWQNQRDLDLLKSFAKNRPYLDAQEIDEALYELLKGKLQSFSIILQSYKDFYLNFYMKEGVILCELPTREELLDAYTYVYMPNYKKHLLALGFAGSENRLRLEIKFATENSFIGIKAKLAILMFKVLRIDIANPCHLVKRFKI